MNMTYTSTVTVFACVALPAPSGPLKCKTWLLRPASPPLGLGRHHGYDRFLVRTPEGVRSCASFPVRSCLHLHSSSPIRRLLSEGDCIVDRRWCHGRYSMDIALCTTVQELAPISKSTATLVVKLAHSRNRRWRRLNTSIVCSRSTSSGWHGCGRERMGKPSVGRAFVVAGGPEGLVSNFDSTREMPEVTWYRINAQRHVVSSWILISRVPHTRHCLPFLSGDSTGQLRWAQPEYSGCVT